MITGLLLPTLALMALAVLIPRSIERWTPETLFGLALTAFLGAIALWLCSGLLFALLYNWQDPRVLDLLGQSRGAAHLATLGLKAAIIWAPMLLLTVITAPRRWKTNVW